MKKLLSAILLTAVLTSQVHANPYFSTILKDPTHPKLSAQVLYTPSFVFDGGVTDVAIVYHKADPDNTLWPQSFLDR